MSLWGPRGHVLLESYAVPYRPDCSCLRAPRPGSAPHAPRETRTLSANENATAGASVATRAPVIHFHVTTASSLSVYSPLILTVFRCLSYTRA